ncbi:hypothetical protein DFJ77DRAFT_469796 [Powellomyces hirtus]|nr:hypothetical protein DFJ77DRAFT_469796 [Powellomyces hirtus]
MAVFVFSAGEAFTLLMTVTSSPRTRQSVIVATRLFLFERPMTSEFIHALRLYRRPPTASELLHANIDRNPLVVGVNSEIALVDSGVADLAVVRQHTLYEHVSALAKPRPSVPPQILKIPRSEKQGPEHPLRVKLLPYTPGQRFRVPEAPSLESLCIASVHPNPRNDSIRFGSPHAKTRLKQRVHSAPSQRTILLQAPSGPLHEVIITDRNAVTHPHGQAQNPAVLPRVLYPLEKKEAHTLANERAPAESSTASASRRRIGSAPPPRVHANSPTRPASVARRCLVLPRQAQPMHSDSEYDPPLSDILSVHGRRAPS